MTAAAKLKPCPFCGAEARMEETPLLGDPDKVRFSVGCASEDAADCMGYQSLTQFNTRRAAAEAWNRRPPREDLCGPQGPGKPEAKIEPPLSLPRQANGPDLWRQVLAMFADHRMPEPPTKLRDEIVNLWAWAQYGEQAALSDQS